MGMVAALVLAIVGTAALVAYVRSAEDRALAGEELVDVLVVAEPIEAGSAASTLGDRVTVEQVPTKVRVEGAVTDLAELAGLVASVELLPGEQLTSDRFVEPSQVAGDGVDVPDGMLEVTLSLDPERALGGRLLPGQHVAVLASFDPFDIDGVLLEDAGFPADDGSDAAEGTEGDGAAALNAAIDPDALPDQTPNTTHIILGPVLVTNVQLQEDFDGDTSIGVGDDGDDETATAPQGELLVTIAIDAPSVERVVFAAEHGTVWLAHQPEGADLDGTSVQDRATVYLPTGDEAS
jgi:pilus assembly protein CpaB